MTIVQSRAELKTDRSFVDEYLHRLVCKEAVRGQGPVQQAMRYAVLDGGQRIRPILSLRIARLLGAPTAITLRAAASVELLHCASLIIDDLPCMDNSPVRRNKPAAHVKFGEATAVLAAFALVSLSARAVVEQECERRERGRLHAFQLELLRSLDCSGLIDGQAMDLQLDGVSHRRTCRNITELKTVPLFQLAVSAGSLCLELDENEQALLKCFGREFGLAFQMADDLADGENIELREIEDKLATLRAVIAPFGGGRRQELEELVDYLHSKMADAIGG